LETLQINVPEYTLMHYIVQ